MSILYIFRIEGSISTAETSGSSRTSIMTELLPIRSCAATEEHTRVTMGLSSLKDG